MQTLFARNRKRVGYVAAALTRPSTIPWPWRRSVSLLSGGTYTTLDDPLVTLGTLAYGINATGQIVGLYKNATGYHGFLLSGG
jgi:probable HAF family extracellular repeat protein